jgi:hypothetical protein
MGLFSRGTDESPELTVRGTFRVTACSCQQFGSAMADSWWTGVVSGPGVAPVAVQHSGVAPQEKMTMPGQVVPVDLDPQDPTRFKIAWDQVPTAVGYGLALAAELIADSPVTPLGGPSDLLGCRLAARQIPRSDVDGVPGVG